MRRDLGDQWGIAEALDGFAMLAAAERQPARALRLAGASAALCAATGLIVAPVRRAQIDTWLGQARRALGAAAEMTWESGRSMPPGDAVAAALAGGQPSGALAGGDAATAGSRARAARLTRRQVEVADCLAGGLSNRAIAGELSIAERTVERHVENILAKLDLHSRTQVAVWAAGRASGQAAPRA